MKDWRVHPDKTWWRIEGSILIKPKGLMKDWRVHPDKTKLLISKVWKADPPNAAKDNGREPETREAYFGNVWVSNDSLLRGILVFICICICICIWSCSPRLTGSTTWLGHAPLWISLRCSISFTKLSTQEWTNTMSTRQGDPSLKHICDVHFFRLKQSTIPTWLPPAFRWKMETNTPPR